MKKLSSALLLLYGLLCCSAALNAATISGRVSIANTGAPATNVTVIIADTARFFIDSTRTNAAGMYSYTVPSAIVSGDLLYTQLRDTNAGAQPYNIGYATFHYLGASVNLDFQVARHTMSGFVNLNGYIRATPTNQERFMQFYVVKKHYDPISAAYMLTAIDSFAWLDQSGSYNRWIDSTTYVRDTLLLKVALQPADPLYSTTIPTYYDTVTQWSNAMRLPACSLSSFSYALAYINMKAGTNPGGPGFIGGSVLLGANKSTGAGDPLAKRIIILTNATTNKAVAYTYSDATGKFQFSNIPYGTYKLFGDVWGKTNPALTVTISSSNGSVSNVVFKENSKDFTGQIGGLGVNGANALLAGISAYPNPAKDYVEVGGMSAISGSKTITLCALNGAVIAKQNIAAGQAAHIATTSLASGIYMLRVQTEEGTVQLKIEK